MHGRKHFGASGLILCLVLANGCGDAPPEPAAPPAVDLLAGTDFDSATAATVQGTVTWRGAVPSIAPFRVRYNLPPSPPLPGKQFHANPNAPQVDAGSRGILNAVVYLRGVDPRRARPWDLPPVRVEQDDKQFHVRQGHGASRVGFVRRGTPVELVSRDTEFYSLHAGGAAFFTLAFPDPDQPLRRRLDSRGVVELSSGASHFWMRAYLFVNDHPYLARTDARGRFTLPRVPPGTYQLVCWLPDWHVNQRQRDPETGNLSRVTFAPPVQWVQSLTITAGKRHTVHFHFRASDFGRRVAE